MTARVAPPSVLRSNKRVPKNALIRKRRQHSTDTRTHYKRPKTPGVIKRNIQRALPSTIIGVTERTLNTGAHGMKEGYADWTYRIIAGKDPKPGFHFSYPIGDHPQVKTMGKNRTTSVKGILQRKGDAGYNALYGYPGTPTKLDNPPEWYRERNPTMYELPHRVLYHDVTGKVGGGGVPFHAKKVSYSRHGTLLEHKRDQATKRELQRIHKELKAEEQYREDWVNENVAQAPMGDFLRVYY